MRARWVSRAALTGISLTLLGWLFWPADVDWRRADGIPFHLRRGVEIGRHVFGEPPATLSLVCSDENRAHLLLLTRLPVPAALRSKVRGTYKNVGVFIGSRTTATVVIDFLVVRKGRDLGQMIDWFSGSFNPDTSLTSPLSAEEFGEIERSAGVSQPYRVAVAGIAETGVFMTGTQSEAAFKAFRRDCNG